MKPKKNNATRAPVSSAASHKRRQNPSPLKLGKIDTGDPNALTVLVAPGKKLTKQISANGVEKDYDRPYEFLAKPVDVSTTEKIVNLVRELADREEFCVTYGAIAPHVKKEFTVQRLAIPRPGVPAAFYEVPRNVFLLDLDLNDITLPEDFNLRDLSAAAALAREQLPDAFHAVEMVFVASSGYLRKPGLRFRAWVRLSRPLPPTEFRRWMHLTKPAGRRKPVIDTTPCQTVGVNYTASPIFEDPAMDPLPDGRIVVLPGKPAADVPPDEFFEPKKPARKSQAKSASAPRAAKRDNPKTPRGQRKERAAPPDLDETFAHLWDDDDAVAAAHEYLATAPIGVKGEGRHTTAVAIFMRLLDIGITAKRAGDLMFELWSPRCVPPYADREELEREIVGLEFARENPVGYQHPLNASKEPTGPSLDDAVPVELDFVDLKEGQRRLVQSVKSTIVDFLEWNSERGEPPAKGQRATVAIGKSEIALRTIFGALFIIRRRRGKRGRRVVVLAVPTHRLSEELEQRFTGIVAGKVESMQQRAREAGDLPRTIARIGRWGKLTVATWRGREAEAPSDPGQKMCLNLEVVREAQKLQQDIEGKVCKRCEHRERCAYRQQYKKRADLWIVAHQTLFASQPKPFRAAGVEFVVIDETIDKAALRGLGANDQIVVQLNELAPSATPLPWKIGSNNARRLERLRASVGRALDRARQCEDFGGLRAAALKGYGITADEAAWAASAERRRIYRGDDPFLLKANRSVAAMARMWKAIADLLRKDGPEVSGRLELRAVHEEGGGRKRCELHITDCDEIHPDFRRPTLLIDASFNAARVKPLFPNIHEVEPINVDAPNVGILQSFGRSSAKSMLLPQPPMNPKTGFTEEEIEKNLTRENNRKALRTNIVNLARRCGGKVLVVTYKDLLPLLDLPPSIETANFNGVAGRDRWADYDVAIIIGRPAPAPEAVESIAGAISGVAPVRAERRWYEQAATRRLVRLPNGFGSIDTEADRHPDETAELHRLRICEEEIGQAVGRLRPIRRKINQAATILILNVTPLPELAIDGFFDAEPFYRAGPEDRMFAEGGIAFESPTDAFKAYPGLWPSVEAAKKALQRSGTRGQIPNKELYGQASYILNREMSRCSIRYQLAGSKQRFKHCSAVPFVVSDPKSELERLLGPLAHFEIVPEPAANAPVPFADLPAVIELTLDRARIARRWLEPPWDD